MNSLKCNALKKPRIIVIKAVETSQYNGDQQIVPVKWYSTIRDTAFHSGRSAYESQDWKRRETANGIAFERGEFWCRISTNHYSHLISIWDWWALMAAACFLKWKECLTFIKHLPSSRHWHILACLILTTTHRNTCHYCLHCAGEKTEAQSKRQVNCHWFCSQ